MNNITNSEFIETVFPSDLVDGVVAICIGPQDTRRATARNLEKAWGKTSYFCISTLREMRRNKDGILSCFVIVFDDIGTKSAPPPVSPSYILETSEGNFQWGYLIEPFDVSGDGAGYVDGVLAAAARAGFNDAGVRGATRIVRLPESLHRTGFISRIVDWHPERAWALTDLVSELGLDVVIEEAGAPGASAVPLDGVEDPVFDWLRARGEAVQAQGYEFFDVECPQSHLHTKQDTGKDRVAGYSPLDYGSAGRQFKCLHAHCADFGTGAFLRWVVEQGGPDVHDFDITTPELRDVILGLGGAISAAPVKPWRRYVYADALQTWIDTETGLEANRQSMNAAVKHRMPFRTKPDGSPSNQRVDVCDAWNADHQKVHVRDFAWLPGAPYGVVEDDGLWFNTYRPKLTPEFDAEISEMFTWHVMEAFEDAKPLLQFLGWTAQRPASKIGWAILVRSAPGIGKSLLAAAMEAALGTVREVGEEELKANFNAYGEGSGLVVLEEVRMHGTRGFEVLNKLKTLITNPRIPVTKKGKDAKMVRNFANVLAFTNFADALPLDEDDRRWHVIDSRAKTKQALADVRGVEVDAYYARLWDAIRVCPAKVLGWLMSIDLTGFDPHFTTTTDAKRRMIGAGASEVELEMVDRLESGGVIGCSPEVFHMKTLRETVDFGVARAIFSRRGYEAHPMPIRIDGKPLRVWYKVAYFPQRGEKLHTAIQENLRLHNEKVKARGAKVSEAMGKKPM